jgi:uncharacterized protein
VRYSPKECSRRWPACAAASEGNGLRAPRLLRASRLPAIGAATLIAFRSEWRPFSGAMLDRGAHAVLKLRPNCECCNADLAADSPDARICTFECTFCAPCAESRLKQTCPNCGGELVRRPRRPVGLLATYPPSTERVYKPQGCASAA